MAKLGHFLLQLQNATKLPYKFGVLLKILIVAGKIKKPANSKICRLLKDFETFCMFCQLCKVGFKPSQWNRRESNISSKPALLLVFYFEKDLVCHDFARNSKGLGIFIILYFPALTDDFIRTA
ncbi:hypothetical protein [Flavobacterium aquicola]|uniref:hypothetical protein n=1 Tax=Flavobacterium aquicola TaxID=1682742 RepID=UPI0011C02D34|nr:hypothetical protein [Flavobacterium aquicola]